MTLNQAISLIHTQATMKLKSQANTLVLSYLWWVLEPLLFVALFYFVFKYVLYRGSEDFFLFLMVGNIPFLWFSKAVNSGANSIVQNKGLIMQRVIPKVIFPLVNCQEAFYKQLFAFSVLIIFLVFNGHTNFQNWWQLIPLILLQYILIAGVASFFCCFCYACERFYRYYWYVYDGVNVYLGHILGCKLNTRPIDERVIVNAEPPSCSY
jgi:lipopolysaccharide transport system permease protein